MTLKGNESFWYINAPAFRTGAVEHIRDQIYYGYERCLSRDLLLLLSTYQIFNVLKLFTARSLAVRGIAKASFSWSVCPASRLLYFLWYY